MVSNLKEVSDRALCNTGTEKLRMTVTFYLNNNTSIKRAHRKRFHSLKDGLKANCRFMKERQNILMSLVSNYALMARGRYKGASVKTGSAELFRLNDSFPKSKLLSVLCVGEERE